MVFVQQQNHAYEFLTICRCVRRNFPNGEVTFYQSIHFMVLQITAPANFKRFAFIFHAVFIEVSHLLMGSLAAGSYDNVAYRLRF